MKDRLIRFLKGRLIILLTVIIIILVVLGIFYFKSNKKSKITNEYIHAKLESASELTTAKLTYTGFTEYTDTGVIILNRSDFLMVYTATARAGIEVGDVDVSTDNITKTIHLKIPKAKILEVKIDPDSIKYYDEKFALFNFDQKEDVNDAMYKAEEKARKDLSNMGILEMADQQSEALLKGLLEDVIPRGYKIVVTKKW